MSSGTNRARSLVAGFTLMELLIALIITAIIVVAASNLEIMRSKVRQTQMSMDALQQQGQLAMYHMGKHCYTAYFLRRASPSDVRIQTVRPGALGEPPDPVKLEEAASFKYDRYWLDTTTHQLIYEQNRHPITLAGLPGFSRMAVATNVESLTVDPMPGEPDVYAVTMVIYDSRTDRRYTLGPMQLASREMVIAPPPGWEPPVP